MFAEDMALSLNRRVLNPTNHFGIRHIWRPQLSNFAIFDSPFLLSRYGANKAALAKVVNLEVQCTVRDKEDGSNLHYFLSLIECGILFQANVFSLERDSGAKNYLVVIDACNKMRRAPRRNLAHTSTAVRDLNLSWGPESLADSSTKSSFCDANEVERWARVDRQMDARELDSDSEWPRKCVPSSVYRDEQNYGQRLRESLTSGARHKEVQCNLRQNKFFHQMHLLQKFGCIKEEIVNERWPNKGVTQMRIFYNNNPSGIPEKYYKDNHDAAEAVRSNGAAVMEGLVVHIYAENIRQQWGGEREREPCLKADRGSQRTLEGWAKVLPSFVIG